MGTAVETVKAFLAEVFDDEGVHPDCVDNHFSKDAAFHDAMPGMEGVEGYKNLLRMLDSATETLAGAQQPIIIEDGDFVSIRWTNKLRQTGELMGVPSSGREFLAKGHETYRVENGKIVENWAIMDIAGMIGQLTG